MAESEMQTASQGLAESTIASDFDALFTGKVGDLGEAFRIKADDEREEIKSAVTTLADMLLKGSGAKVAPENAARKIKAIIEEIDNKLSEQVRTILHHEEFQEMESAWRGLHYLVKNTETSTTLKIKFMNISRVELGKTLEKFDGVDWDQSPIFKRIYEDEYGSPGGSPVGCIVGDYYFKHTHEDVQLLAGMAKICAAAHTPFIAAADPGVMRMDSWGELAGPSDLAQIFDTPAHAAWNALRESEDSRFLGLTLPRFLGRIPYGASTKKVEEFNFEEFEEAGVDRENGPVSEDADSTRSGNYLWVNAAYAMAANINRAFKRHGWCTQIRGPDDSAGGKVEGLPVYHFPTDDGGVDMTCPTEIAITDRREKELADCGFMPLSHYKNTNHAVFMGAQSLQKPAQYDDADATASANLMARLPYVFAVSRFAHYLKCIAREQIGTFKEREDMQKLLQRWINRYVEPNPEMASDLDKARKPLAAAEIKVEEVEGNPGYYTSRFWLRPHYQLEGLTARLSMVSTLPSVKK